MNMDNFLASRDYIQTPTGQRLFPTLSSLHHFARQHAPELIGSVYTHRGRRYIHAEAFERTVAGIIAAKG